MCRILLGQCVQSSGDEEKQGCTTPPSPPPQGRHTSPGHEQQRIVFWIGYCDEAYTAYRQARNVRSKCCKLLVAAVRQTKPRPPDGLSPCKKGAATSQQHILSVTPPWALRRSPRLPPRCQPTRRGSQQRLDQTVVLQLAQTPAEI